MEIWKDIQGYEGLYQVSNIGNIKSLDRTVGENRTPYLKKGRILKAWKYNGYLCVNLCGEGKNVKLKVHRIVAETFIDNPKNKKEVNHINGNKTDNRVENLEWCSHKENIQHAFRTGLRKTGTNATNSKLSVDDINYIIKNIRLKSHKYGARAMARKYNVCYSTITQILHGKTYIKEAQALGIDTRTPDELAEMKSLWENGK